ncbi:MAG: HAMP domain-containing sensor histidine kinase [Candidatus Promineifilaceae bacterium]|nr:HAMP domain-containing sensor histidine kinase [Candidatus Promineifilaceae bacterium]
MSGRRRFLPALLAALALLLLARILLSYFGLSEGPILLPGAAPPALEVLLLLTLLGVALVAAIHSMMRLWIDALRTVSVRRVRREALAEHSRFLSRLDHELKNPLTAVRTGLSTLRLTELDERQRRLVETMETETVRLSRLVADLRKLAALETQPLNIQPVAMGEFGEQMVQLQQERFATGGRTLRFKPPAPGVVWRVDEDLLALAVANLLDNAFKYTVPGDEVRLSIDAGPLLVLEVADSGIGVSAEALPHIFEELYRAREVQTIPGSGLGLALVKAIVERHDGEIEVASRPGEGTAVRIQLPPLLQE